MAKFIELGDLEDIENIVTKALLNDSQEEGPVGRKDPEDETLIFNTLRKLQVDWVSPTGHNV